MSIRKRKWTTTAGEAKEGWQADYVDGAGKRRRKMFAKKKDADAFLAGAKVEVRDGIHVPDAETITIEEAGKLWIKTGIAAGLERTTIEQRHQHLDLHILPLIGLAKLTKVTVPFVRAFQDKLRENGRSPAMVKRATVSLGSILGDAQGRGLTVRNAVHEMARSRTRVTESKVERRQKAKLRVGVDIPAPEEIAALIGKAAGRWRPLLLTLIFTGLRSSEIRGLRWEDIDLKAQVMHVRQRADRFNDMGRPKSEAGERAIPLPEQLVKILREWKLACPKGELGLAFPNGSGKPESHANIVNRGLVPAMIAAGVTMATGRLDEDGRPILAAKYTGLHALRHFYASWCINAVPAGGMGLQPKVVQERLGHAQIAMTLDTYGHLFPSRDDGTQVTAAAALLLG